MNRILRSIKPTQLFVLSFVFVIFFGAFLLWLPISSASGEFTPFLDCLFTATSASCVTGLTVVNTAAHWSAFGKIVVISMIQVGGLGFITLITVIFLLAGKRITLKERVLIQETFNLSQTHGIVRFVKFLSLFTFTVEVIGAIILTLRFIPDYGFPGAIPMGIFHSISAFCNAGFDIIGSSSISPYVDDPVINIVLMALVITGGLGFPVWVELIGLRKALKKSKETPSFRIAVKKLSVHTKIVVCTTLILIFSGAFLTFILEYNNPLTLGELSMQGKIFASFFHSVVLRTAGFFSIDMAGLHHSTEFLSIILMMIGGSPCGTAGGMKTISVAVVLLAVISLVKDRDSIIAFKRSISFNSLQKALAVIILMLTILMTATTLLSITEVNMAFDYEFIDLMFEVASALGTVGNSIGITPYLTSIGKVIIMLCMFIGRLGPITIAIAFMSTNSDKNKIHYPTEDVMVG